MSETSRPRPYHHGNLRATLLDAAERELREHGADQLSLRDLAREAGVSHAAPRRHFADRQQLLDALAEAGFLRLGRALRHSLSGSEQEFPVRVRNAVSAYVHFASGNAALLDLMHSSKHRPGAISITAAAEGAYEPMVELIRNGQENGSLERGDPEKIGIILFATVQGIAAMVNGGMIDPQLLDGLVETAVSQFLRGASPSGQ